MKKRETVGTVKRERERESNNLKKLGLIYNAKIIYKYRLKRIEYCVKQQKKKLYLLHDTLSFL